MNEPEITRRGFLSMQVCVPTDYTDSQVNEFAEKEYPCGTENGWFIRREGDKALNGCPERAACEDRENCVHIMLDA